MNEGEIIFTLGAFAGALGSLWFIARSVPPRDKVGALGKRKLAIGIVLALYLFMALVATLVGLMIQNPGVIGAAVPLLILAIVGFVCVWKSNAV